MKMGLIAGRHLQNPGFDLDKALLVEPGPERPGDRAPRLQKRPDDRRAARPTTRVRADRFIRSHAESARKPLALSEQNQYVAARNRLAGPRTPMSGPVPGQNIRKNSFESHRQFYSQGQRHRARRQALRGPDRREHPPRQGNPGQPDRNAPDQRRRKDFRALQDHRPGREGDHRGSQLQLPLRRRRRLPLHERRDLRSGSGAQGRRRQRRALPAGKHDREAVAARRGTGGDPAAAAGDAGSGRDRTGHQGPDRLVVL